MSRSIGLVRLDKEIGGKMGVVANDLRNKSGSTDDVLVRLYDQLLKESVPGRVLSEQERRKTAQRAADSWRFQLSGYHQTLDEVVGDALYPVVRGGMESSINRETRGVVSSDISNHSEGGAGNIINCGASNNLISNFDNDDLVVVGQIAFHSLCEHHLMPIAGFCHIAYLPNQHLLGLSKFARIVEMFARRLQLQERFTREVAEAIQQVTSAKGVGVMVVAEHCCMCARGVERREARMVTESRLGALRTPELWRRFMNGLGLAMPSAGALG